VVVDDYNCVSCHDLVHSSGLDLTTADATYLNTHDVDVNDPLNPVAQKRIAPCEPEASYLWHVVNGTVAPGVDYETMPRYGTELNKHQLADLQNWILEGARLE
jgi:hypothetical protein